MALIWADTRLALIVLVHEHEKQPEQNYAPTLPVGLAQF